jgi:hypothetical protein
VEVKPPKQKPNGVLLYSGTDPRNRVKPTGDHAACELFRYINRQLLRVHAKLPIPENRIATLKGSRIALLPKGGSAFLFSREELRKEKAHW